MADYSVEHRSSLQFYKIWITIAHLKDNLMLINNLIRTMPSKLIFLDNHKNSKWQTTAMYIGHFFQFHKIWITIAYLKDNLMLINNLLRTIPSKLIYFEIIANIQHCSLSYKVCSLSSYPSANLMTSLVHFYYLTDTLFNQHISLKPRVHLRKYTLFFGSIALKIDLQNRPHMDTRVHNPTA